LAAAALPAAWLDDASLLTPSTAALTIGVTRWAGADLSEVDFPVVSAAIGLAPRFQIGASVPRVVGSADGTGPVGGIGTSYISGKIGPARTASSWPCPRCSRFWATERCRRSRLSRAGPRSACP
jgi:hypothetical protein